MRNINIAPALDLLTVVPAFDAAAVIIKCAGVADLSVYSDEMFFLKRLLHLVLSFIAAFFLESDWSN